MNFKPLQNRRWVRWLACATVLFSMGSATFAQNYPNRSIKFIVPYSAGGTSDILGRKLAQQLTERLGRQVLVENKAGAGGAIGTEATVRADADGTTMLLHSGAIATEPAIKARLPYDVTRDLIAVTTVVRGPFAMLVSNDLPVHEYTALQLKKAVAGHGRAGKAEARRAASAAAAACG